MLTALKYIILRTFLEAGFGAFSRTFLKSNTWLGEYDGEILLEEDDYIVSDYAWEMYRSGNLSYFIDAALVERSNWLRWLNCPKTIAGYNVDGMYCYGKVYYLTTKDVYPGQELQVYYGFDYALRLGIYTNLFESND